MSDKTIIGYMDKVDFDEELGVNSYGNKVYPSIEALEKHKPCAAKCGIVKVEVRLVEVVRDTKGTS